VVLERPGRLRRDILRDHRFIEDCGCWKGHPLLHAAAMTSRSRNVGVLGLASKGGAYGEAALARLQPLADAVAGGSRTCGCSSAPAS
jgi:hypothetical protein